MSITDSELFLNTYIVAPRATKTYFLNLKVDNPTYNFKFFTKEELEELAFGKIKQDEATLLLMKKFDLPFSVARKYVNYIKRGACSENTCDKISKYKSALLENNLISKDEVFPYLLKGKKAIFIGYGYSKSDNNEISHLIDDLKISNYEFYKFSSFIDNPIEKKPLYKFESLEEETKYLLNLVSEALTENKKIKIICNQDTYFYYLNFFADSFNLKFNYKNSNSLFNTECGKHLFNVLLNDQDLSLSKYMKENENILLAKYGNDFLSIKDILSMYDFDNLDKKILNLKEILQGFLTNNKRYVNAPIVQSTFDFDENYDYFVLDISEGNFPSIATNNDLLDDADKKTFMLETSDQKNETTLDLSEAFIKFKAVKFLSFHTIDNGGIHEKSFFVKDYTYEKNPMFLNYEYSLTLAKDFYQSYQFTFDKYGDIPEGLMHYKSTPNFLLPTIYNPVFKDIKFEENKDLDYSYTLISTYYRCPFQFYCQNVLKLYRYDDSSFYSKYGSLAHNVFEKVYSDEDFSALYDSEVNKFEFSTEEKEKEKFFLESLKGRLEFTFNAVRNRRKYEDFDETPAHEIDLKYRLPSGHTLVGRVDSVVFLKSKAGKKYLYVVDYKTGDVNFNVDLIPTGYEYSMQLPTYIYLLEKTEEYSRYTVAGSYIQTLKQKYKDILQGTANTYLKGITLDEENAICAIDKTISTSNIVGSNILDPIKNGKKGVVYCYYNKFKNVYSETKFSNMKEEYETLLEKFDENYKAGNFEIRSIDVKGSNGCKYCEFYDICFLKNRRTRKITILKE